MSLACIRGCVRKGRHVTTHCACQCHQGAVGAYPCDLEGGCHSVHQAHAADCKGCMPAPAAVGQVCVKCHGRVQQALGQVPELIEHCRAHVEPGAVRRDDMPRASGKSAPAPLSLDALDEADALYAALHSWHETTTNELDLSELNAPGRLNVKGHVIGTRWGDDYSKRMCARMLGHIDRICAYEWSAEMIGELTDVVAHAARRFPVVERPLYLPTPCPACDMLSLVRYAPQEFEGHSVIACRSCGETVAERLYDWHARRVLAEQQEERARIVAELTAAQQVEASA